MVDEESPEPIDVAGVVDGPLRVLVIDATANDLGFEYWLSDVLYESLKRRDVPLVDGGVKRPTSLPDFAGMIAENDFNALLWVAHGTPAGFVKSSSVQLGERRVFPWAILMHAGIELTDKLVVLAVCYAANKDMRDSLHVGTAMALVVVGPEGQLFERDAKSFFPAFFAELLPFCETGIDPHDVENAAAKCAELVNTKMHVTYGGNVLPESQRTWRGRCLSRIMRLVYKLRPSAVKRYLKRRHGKRNLVERIS